MAFEDANIKEACKGHDFCYMVDSFNHNDTLGNLLSTGADFSWKAWHHDVFGAMAQSHIRDIVLFLRQSSRLLLDAYDNNLYLLHTYLD